MTKLIVPLVALTYTRLGVATEADPLAVLDTTDTNLDDKEIARLTAADFVREPSEMEVALWERQNPGKLKKASPAPVAKKTEPETANGPGGATGETTKDAAGGSVASDTNTVGAGEQGEKTDEQKQAEADQGQGEPAKADAKTPAKKTTAKKRADEDLA